MKFIRGPFYHFGKEVSPAPKFYGFSFTVPERDVDIYYPIPINYIIRYLTGLYWKILRCFYWIGVIDTPQNEKFRWADFFRIKTHS